MSAAAAPSSPPPRRTTRSSLSRFAYSSSAQAPPPPGPDIEDAIPDLSAHAHASSSSSSSSAAVSRKRKRTAASRRPSSSSTAQPAQPVNAAPKRTRKPARADTGAGAAAAATPPPAWAEVYELIRGMRAAGGAAADAPVDALGCERLADPGAGARDRRLQTLVALMLSSRTRDAATAAAMRNLRTSLPAHAPAAAPGLTLANLLAAPPAQLDALIRPVGFHRTKAAHLRRAAAALAARHGGDVPATLPGLLALPGVGPKMAHLCLGAAWGRAEGIGVDVHVHRISQRLGWSQQPPQQPPTRSTTPEATRRALEAWLPRPRWREVNALLVGFGQTVCRPLRPRCGDCEVGLRGLCPGADRAEVREGRRRRRREERGEAGVKEEEVEEEVVVEREAVVSEDTKEKKQEEEEEEQEEEDKDLGPANGRGHSIELENGTGAAGGDTRHPEPKTRRRSSRKR
ncbi:DNA glycosylase, partial [Xylariomycetidae sp. FL0641]